MANVDLEDVRNRIIKLARDKKSRVIPQHLPCRFNPDEVINPETGMYFDKISAWHFIADLAESGHPIKEITLENPKGEKGYEMIVKSQQNFPNIYIKVQLKGNMIYCRSFHLPIR